MFIDDGRLVIEEMAGVNAVPPTPAPGYVTLYPDNLTNHIHQLDSSGIYIDICYPSFLRYFNWSWDVEGVATSANINNWQCSVISAGTFTVVTTSIASGTPTATQAVDLANHPGVLSINSSTTANSGGQITWGGTTNAIRLKSGLVFDCIFFCITFTNTTYRIGFCDSTTVADAVDGAYIEIQPGGTLVAKTANNSTRTTGSASLSAAVNTWYHCRITLESDTSAKFVIYDNVGAEVFSDTINTNVPNDVGRDTLPRFIVTNSGTTATLLAQVDYVGWRGPMNRGGPG